MMLPNKLIGLICSITLVDQTHSVVIQVQPDDLMLQEVNDRPIIGILSQEMDSELDRLLPLAHNYTSYIAGSYVQWVEAGGARVVPIIIGKSQDYYEDLFRSLNGLLLPGGSAPLVGPGGYAEVGQLFFELAVKASDAGDPFPIWGTCNGFELLTVVSSKEHSHLTHCSSENMANPISLLPDWKKSQVYGEAPKEILRQLTQEKVTVNFHENCLTPTNFTKFKLDNFWTALSINNDSNNLEYISTIEAKNYPFIGVQFHPEKNIFEWALESVKSIPHSRHAVAISQYFARYFVNLARQSHHKFPNRSTEESFLIFKYNSTYVGKIGVDSTVELKYFF